jgi:hypothetical protein
LRSCDGVEKESDENISWGLVGRCREVGVTGRVEGLRLRLRLRRREMEVVHVMRLFPVNLGSPLRPEGLLLRGLELDFVTCKLIECSCTSLGV